MGLSLSSSTEIASLLRQRLFGPQLSSRRLPGCSSARHGPQRLCLDFPARTLFSPLEAKGPLHPLPHRLCRQHGIPHCLGSIPSLLSPTPSAPHPIAIFSDQLNHASIIDGIHLAERQSQAKLFVYRHSDMLHLHSLLSGCSITMKVVITDSLFSMDGDFAPLTQLVELRKKHGFLLAIDDAHATLVCGENGGGAGEYFGCEKDIDICIGTLSKAVGCHGGFIATSKRWKSLIQSRGRSFIFSTTIPVPVVAASLAAISVGRRRAIWRRVQDFYSLSGLPISSPIISIIVGTEEAALSASRHLLKSGLHVMAIRPPTVAPNSCRLRITLSAAHTVDDIKKLVATLSPWITTLNSNLLEFSKL
ncbi:8-amino-7-oxononanoate synthase-like protein [Rhynchospora pubera]|uniref:serine C-palmitoyltransferase n=1 Tax=Rhynchospora pubera TaxID=906938 RepID=A0AAV8G121_9POAL|nr:8-amino-7-oxononanoate synthase-like protein [Rhynchospora pubera]